MDVSKVIQPTNTEWEWTGKYFLARLCSFPMGSTLTTVVLCTGGALFFLLFALWLAVTVYLYLQHRRYAHIPSPRMPR